MPPNPSNFILIQCQKKQFSFCHKYPNAQLKVTNSNFNCLYPKLFTSFSSKATHVQRFQTASQRTITSVQPREYRTFGWVNIIKEEDLIFLKSPNECQLLRKKTKHKYSCESRDEIAM